MAPFTLKKMSLLVPLLHQLKQGWYKNLREKKKKYENLRKTKIVLNFKNKKEIKFVCDLVE